VTGKLSLNPHQAYCCEAHQNIAKSKRRKARLRGLAGEPLSVWEIYERDGGRCHICGEHVHDDIKWPDGRAPSVDHVLPITKGGSDEPENLKLAHLRCNISKGNRVPPPHALGPCSSLQVRVRNARQSSNFQPRFSVTTRPRAVTA
jgi:hypothetical protein